MATGLARAAAVDDDIGTTISPAALRAYVQQAGATAAVVNVRVLARVLERCAVLASGRVAQMPGADVDVTRACALYAVARMIGRVPEAEAVVRQYFCINRAVGSAILAAQPALLMPLLDREINRIFQDNRVMLSPRDLAQSCPDTQFELWSHGLLDNAQVNAPDADAPMDEAKTAAPEHVFDCRCVTAMRDAAVLLERAHTARARDICLLLLRHERAFLWEKQVYRAMARMPLTPQSRFTLLTTRLRMVANKETDTCRWNWAAPDAQIFTLKTCSAEAQLVLLCWTLAVPVRDKVQITLPSLKSKSFTARAAAIDRLASVPALLPQLKPVVRAPDVDTRRFLALRLAQETGAMVRTFLDALSQDADDTVKRLAR
jgi:hypothetical protein